MELAVVVTLIVLYLTLGSSRTAAFGGLVQKNKYGQSKQRIGIVAGRRKLAGPSVYREDFEINGFDHLSTLEGNRRFQREKRASELEGSDTWTLRNKLLVGGGGFLVILVCTAICLWCFCRRKNRKPRKLKEEVPDQTEEFEGTLITSANHNDGTANGGTPSGNEENKRLLSSQNRSYRTYQNVVHNFQDADLSSAPSTDDGEQKSAPIRKGQLANVVQQLASTEDGFKSEYDELRGRETAKYEYSQNEANKPKNRFKNILPYDHSLVVLTDGLGSDYINASYITGYNGKKRAFIATQGPLDSTIGDFWRMIWQEESTEIIMLANLIENKKKKCSKYWPDETKTALHGTITVHNVKECKETLQYTVRHFELTQEGTEEKKHVRQYHYTAWGDMTDITSATPIWEILKQMRLERKKSNDEEIADLAPIVVHCSAGCGRTGTVITLDVMRQMMKRDKQVDIFNFINQMRTERMVTVQVVTQYRFVYESLLIYMRLKRTNFPRNKFVEKLGVWNSPGEDNSMSALQKQFQLLKFLHPELQDTKETKAGLQPENKNKNRDMGIIPDDINRPLLQTRVEDDETSTNYINACFFNGYTKRSLFLATQAPLESTYTDFWRMLFDYKAETVVAFHGNDRTVYPNYWPSDSAELGPFAIENKGEEKVTDYLTIRDFELKKVTKGSEKNTKNVRNIRQFCINNFGELEGDQQSALLIDLITQRINPRQAENNNARMAVHCEFGVGLSAIFIALYAAIDMLGLENQVDVFTIVKQMRMWRHNMLDTFDKYQQINEAVKYYIENPPPVPGGESSDEDADQSIYVNMT